MSREKQIEEMARILNRANGLDDTPAWYNDFLPDAEALYNADYRKQKWISVDERLPGDLGEYIVMIQGAVTPTTLWYNPWEEVWHEGDNEYYVSHWMPLPEAPKMKGGAE